MRVTIFDYGAGNLHSLQRALAAPGTDVALEPDPNRCAMAEVLVLPGVGAFAPASARLAPAAARLRDAIDRGLPVIGICLGMQLLFETSAEGAGQGLGVLAGRVEPLRARRVPQIGWNTVTGADPLLTGITHGYYANSFVCRPSDASCVSAWSELDDDRFPAVVRANGARRVIGFQFHPEKSGRAGVALLRRAIAEVAS